MKTFSEMSIVFPISLKLQFSLTIETMTDGNVCNVRERMKLRRDIFHCAVGVFCTNISTISTIDNLCLTNHE